MKTSTIVLYLTIVTAVLALVTSGIGLAYQDAGAPFSFTTVRGEVVQMYGQGLYRYETTRDGTGFKGVDIFVLGAGVPLLLLFTLLYRRGSLRGALLLTGTLAFFVYNSASMTFGYAYNPLFLLYVAQFSSSLFAFVLALLSFDLQALSAPFWGALPRRGLAAFLFATSGSLILVWGGMDILPALLTGHAPPLTGHTTLPTHALDMGIIAPAAFIAGVLVLKRKPFGYLLASVMVIVSAVLGAGVLALSTVQILNSVITFEQALVFVVPFAVLTACAIWLTCLLLRNVSSERTLRGMTHVHAARV